MSESESSEKSEDRVEPLEWPAPVLRVGLRWRGESWSIVSTTRVESMTLPASDDLIVDNKTAGFWIEAVDRKGRVRYRRVMTDPLRGMEIFGRDGEITRISHEGQEVDAEVLVPDFPDTPELRIVSKPAEPGERARAYRQQINLEKAGASGESGHGDDQDHNDH